MRREYKHEEMYVRELAKNYRRFFHNLLKDYSKSATDFFFRDISIMAYKKQHPDVSYEDIAKMTLAGKFDKHCGWNGSVSFTYKELKDALKLAFSIPQFEYNAEHQAIEDLEKEDQ